MRARSGGGVKPPKVFQIGLTGLGTKWMRRVFRRSGYTVASGESDRLAVDIRYAQLTGSRPLSAFADVDLFTDMESPRSPAEPPLFGQLEFEFLHRHYQDAYFLLNVGDFDSWLRRRADSASPSDLLQVAALKEGLEEADLPHVWRDRWVRHEASARAYFAGYERFLVFDVESQGLAELAAFVSPSYDVTSAGAPPAPRRSKPGPPLVVPSRKDRSDRADPGLVDEVVTFATASNPEVPTGMPWRKVSRLYAYWGGDQTVLGRDGRPLPCVIDPEAADWPFLLNHPQRKHRRTEGTLNELWQHGLRQGAHVDMQDARRYGVDATGAPHSSVVTYCRRAGSAGLVLWPLPGYHTPGSPDFPCSASKDELSFSEKLDSIAWRGNLTGRALPELGPAGAVDEHARDLTARLGGHEDEQVLAALDTVPRFRVLTRWVDRPDADVGLVLGDSWAAGLPAQLARLQRPRLSYSELYRHRYLLSLSGNDGASNFLMAADSSSVVLREEDGWEAFYDGLFRPWEHYIPVSRGGDDLDDKLEWARANTQQCRDMSARSQEAVRRLVRLSNRWGYLNGIREVYESRFRPR